MFQQWIELIIEAIQESLLLFPYLFITYLILEYIEHKTKIHHFNSLGKTGIFAPIIGALSGLIPQCGIAAAAANFYAARVISIGTLMAVFLAASDEMIPVLISNGIPFSTILSILIFKLTIACVIGLLIDFILRQNKRAKITPVKINELCTQTNCHCEKGIFISAFLHSIQILVFVFMVSLILNTLIAVIGINTLEQLIFKKTIVGEMLASLVGLIPSCAPSVIITQLYAQNTITFGAFMAGLLTNAGVGLLVLFRVNRPLIQNIKILALLYFSGVICGILINMFNSQF